MARRTHGRGRIVSVGTRLTNWGALTDGADTMASSGTAVLAAALSASFLAMRPFTVIRYHLQLALRSDQEAAMENQRVAVGMAVVSDQSVAVGVTAVPTPVTDVSSDLWFLHQWIMGGESRLVDKVRAETYLSVDSKAMRKVNDDQDLIMVVESAANIGSGAILASAGRFLIKLH